MQKQSIEKLVQGGERPSSSSLAPEELAAACAARGMMIEEIFQAQSKPMTDLTRNLYLQQLERIVVDVHIQEGVSLEAALEVLDAAIERCCQELKFRPAIAEIRERTGLLSPMERATAGADAAWLYVQEYLCQWPDYGEGIGRGKQAPRLPARIEHTIRLVGGLRAIEYAEDSRLPFIRKDFCAAWERFEKNSTAYNALQLEAPVLLPQLMAEVKPKSCPGKGKQHVVAPTRSEEIMTSSAMSRPLSPEELEDMKRRAFELAAKFATQ